MKKINILILCSFVFFAGCASQTVVRQPVVIQRTVEVPAPAAAVQVVPVSTPKIAALTTTPLIHAVSSNDYNSVQYLIGRGDNPNEVYYSAGYEALPLQEAVRRGNLDIADYLIRYAGAAIDLRANDKTALEMAIQKNDYEMVRLLISNGAEIIAPNILEYGVREKDILVLKYLLDAGAGSRYYAVSARDADYALLKAARIGNLTAIKLLIDAGADASVIDERGRNVIFYAVQRTDAAVLEFVFPYASAMVNIVDIDGTTPLMVAVQYNNYAGVQFLVSRGAYIDARNRYNFDAVYYSKNAQITKYLKEEEPRRKRPAGYEMEKRQPSKYEDKKTDKKEALRPAVSSEKDKNQQPAKKIEPAKPAAAPSQNQPARPAAQTENKVVEKKQQTQPARPAQTTEKTQPAQKTEAAKVETKPAQNQPARPTTQTEKNKTAEKNQKTNTNAQTKKTVVSTGTAAAEPAKTAEPEKPAQQTEARPQTSTPARPAAAAASSTASQSASKTSSSSNSKQPARPNR